MAGALAFECNEKQKRILFAVHAGLEQAKAVPRRIALDPEFVSRCGPERHIARFQSCLKRRGIDVAEHEHVSARFFLHNSGQDVRDGGRSVSKFAEIKRQFCSFFQVHASSCRGPSLTHRKTPKILAAKNATGECHLVQITLPKTGQFQGTVNLPGSKSLANRLLLLAALAEGRTLLHGIPDGEDVQVLLHLLPALGITSDVSGTDVRIQGAAGPFPIREAVLNVENAGTAMRPLAAVLCAGQGSYTVDGNEQMRRRPIGDLIRGLRTLGLAVQAQENQTGKGVDLCPPVHIEASGIPGGTARLSGSISSQFISALLLAAPLAKGPVRIEVDGDPVSKPYIDMTIQVMSRFGVSVERQGYTAFQVDPGVYRSPGELTVEGDATAATYFLSLGALSGPVTVKTLYPDSLQGDIRYAALLEQMGAVVERGADGITVRRGALRGLDVDMNDMPDAAMTLAVLALFADGPVRIRNIANLRVKESERIAGLASELRKLGAGVTDTEESITVVPPAKLKPAEIETYRDHRMAMAFSLASFGTEVTILDPACVNKTYPQYFKDFASVAR